MTSIAYTQITYVKQFILFQKPLHQSKLKKDKKTILYENCLLMVCILQLWSSLSTGLFAFLPCLCLVYVCIYNVFWSLMKQWHTLFQALLHQEVIARRQRSLVYLRICLCIMTGLSQHWKKPDIHINTR